MKSTINLWSLVGGLLLGTLFQPCMSYARKTNTKTTIQALKGLQFPSLKAENLSREKMSLPGALQGKLNLVLIAFWRRQQREINTWLAYLKPWKKKYPGLRFYELPTIRRGMRFFRFFIDGGMRSGIPDKSARQRTITLYIDKKPFRKALGLAHEKTIYALLVDKQGKVFWKASGLATKKNRASIHRFLKAYFQK